MRRTPGLFLLSSALVMGQAAGLDEGRLDPSWFGAGAVFRPSKNLGFQWLKPGLDLRNRSIRLKVWEPTAWLLGKRELKDERLLVRVEKLLPTELDRRLRKGLKGAIPVSPTQGDLILVGRVVDAVGEEADSMAMGHTALSFDLKLVDGDSGELLGAFHDTLQGLNNDAISSQYGRWCEDLGRLLAGTASTSGMPIPAKPVPAAPAFDLEGALRRIEGLKRDGLLSEEECQALRKKAAEKAKGL